MAFAVTFNFQIADDSGDVAPAKVKVPNGFTIAQYTEFGLAMAQIIATAIEGRIKYASVNFKLSLAGATIRSSALTGADIKNKAMMLFDSATAGFGGKVQIPTYNDVNNVSLSDAINPADPDIDAFVEAMTDGIDVGGAVIIAPVNGRGMDLTAFRGGAEQFRANRKRPQ